MLAAEPATGIQAIYSALAADPSRERLIVADVLAAIRAGRSPLVLTERTDHRDRLAATLSESIAHVFVISGGMSTKKRRATAEAMAATPATAPRVVVATGRCVGEGFDDARLDTLFLAMPVAWRGTLQQYAGAPAPRAHTGKADVIIYDYVDDGVPVLARMHQKRLAGYRAMGYTVEDEPEYVEPWLSDPVAAPAPPDRAIAATRQLLSASSRMRSSWAISSGRSKSTLSSRGAGSRRRSSRGRCDAACPSRRSRRSRDEPHRTAATRGSRPRRRSRPRAARQAPAPPRSRAHPPCGRPAL